MYLGERLVIPTPTRKIWLKELHRGDLWIQCVKKNTYCILVRGRHWLPKLAWSKVVMDIMNFRASSYLVVVYCYSDFPELKQLRNKSSNDVILALKSLFSVHDVPLNIMADNMPFSSQSMKQFAQKWGFTIVTSGPHYPKLNGMNAMCKLSSF